VERYICIHGHFYQPPRENPWLDTIERQETAYPYHDWNERITAECYAPNAAARILDSHGELMFTVNNYSKMSFNFGPTLLEWMEKYQPDVYRSVIEADRLSRERFSGHGSAWAQVYNHMIMPLANRRDKYTQVHWGIRDFEKRYGRFPDGMWLPETAVDFETLEILAQLGIKITLLAPHQARRAGEVGRGTGNDAAAGEVDSTKGYLCRFSSGRSINIFFYDGAISHGVAFGGLLRDGETFARRLVGAFEEQTDHPQIVHIATDGETYGHHHRYGEMALAYCLGFIQWNNLARLTNYAEYLSRHPPTEETEIVENSSWSCSHGVERWRDNCGCHSGMHPGWTQAWRKPLRQAMDWLGKQLNLLFDEEAGRYLSDPWRARDDYIEVLLDRSPKSIQRFLKRNARRNLAGAEKERVFKLLEMEKNGLFSYTSCGWFFDDIAGLEAVQVMRYAARAMELALELTGVPLEPDYLRMLEAAPSNLHENGAKVYDLFVKRPRMSAVP
jgi:alpha-amylase/alpha-mannosidase (GH57 family)